jgi:hypothetical protein
VRLTVGGTGYLVAGVVGLEYELCMAWMVLLGLGFSFSEN